MMMGESNICRYAQVKMIFRNKFEILRKRAWDYKSQKDSDCNKGQFNSSWHLYNSLDSPLYDCMTSS